MTDRLTKAARSRLMGRIQGGPKNQLQRRVHGWLCAKHVHHEMEPRLGGAGRPDVAVYPPAGRRVPVLLIFVDGCFWHGCPLHYREPASNVDYWREHIAGNRARDGRRAALPYPWVRVWEHEITGAGDYPAGAYKAHLWHAVRAAIEAHQGAGQAPLAAYAEAH